MYKRDIFTGSYAAMIFCGPPPMCRFHGHSVDPTRFKELLAISPCPKDDIKNKLTAISYKLNDISDNLTDLFKPNDRDEIDNVLQKAITTLQSQITCQKLADIYFDLNFLVICGLENVISTDVESVQKDLISIINSLEKNNIPEIKLSEIESLAKLCLKTIKKSIESNNPKLGDLNKLPPELLKRFSKEQLQGKVSAALLGQLFQTKTYAKPLPNTSCDSSITCDSSIIYFWRNGSLLQNDTWLTIITLVFSPGLINEQLLLEDNKHRESKSFSP